MRMAESFRPPRAKQVRTSLPRPGWSICAKVKLSMCNFPRPLVRNTFAASRSDPKLQLGTTPCSIAESCIRSRGAPAARIGHLLHSGTQRNEHACSSRMPDSHFPGRICCSSPHHNMWRCLVCVVLCCVALSCLVLNCFLDACSCFQRVGGWGLRLTGPLYKNLVCGPAALDSRPL